MMRLGQGLRIAQRLTILVNGGLDLGDHLLIFGSPGWDLDPNQFIIIDLQIKEKECCLARRNCIINYFAQFKNGCALPRLEILH